MILLIDTSHETGTVALAKEGIVLFSEENKIAKEHAVWLHTAIARLLAEAKITVHDLKAVAVIAGPGSYTGLRVGMAAAKGFCYALKIPLITQNTLFVMAASMLDLAAEKGAMICPMIDARRDEVFTALYERSTLNAERLTLNAERSTLNAERLTLNAERLTLNAEGSMLNAERSTLNAERLTLNAERLTLNAERSTLNAERLTLNAERLTLNAERSTLNAERSTLNAERSTLNAERLTLNAERLTLNAERSTLNAEREPVIDLTEILPPQAMILDKNSFETNLSKGPVVFFGSGAEKWKKISTSANAIFESQPNSIQAFAMLAQKDFLSANWADTIYSEPVYLKEFFTY